MTKEESQLIKILEAEVKIGKQNQQYEIEEFQSVIDLFDAIRTEKDYEWMSDIFIPEFPSHMLTQSAIDVAQYFQTRDFVEVYVQDESQEALDSADAAKECVNRTLNRKELYHYQKYVRAKSINHLKGSVILETCWEQEIMQEPVFNGEDYEYDETGEIQYRDIILKDNFNYDIVDPRNVFMSSEYVYSLQDKNYVIIRTEKTLQDLKNEEKKRGYFNLDKLKDVKPAEKTEAQKDTEDDPKNKPKNLTNDKFDIYKRYGKFWITPEDKIGIDEDGEVKPNARLEEVMMSYASNSGTNTLIQFHRQPYHDANNKPYRTIIRGLCYIHPTNDNGVGDGKYDRELQVAINDTFNLGNDRTRLATMPTLKVKKNVLEDTDSVYFEPSHSMEVNDKDDITEFKISDNIEGALEQLTVLVNKMREVDSINVNSLGGLPDKSSQTATAIVGAQNNTTQRSNYKSMTFEFTGLIELYWQIQQMTWQFAKPETGYKLMGEKVYDFNPTLDYFYKPLSQSIETDEGKNLKVQRWMSILQIVASLQHPDAPKLFNYIMSRIAELMGDEYVNFAVAMLNPGEPLQQANQTGVQEGVAGPSNQYGINMGGMESMTREGINGRMGY